jgi:ribosomal protein L11 methyltransferase
MTYTATSKPLSEADARRLSEALASGEMLECQAVDAAEIAPGQWRVVVYLETPPTQEIAALVGLPGLTGFTVSPLPDADWVASSQAALPPVRVGRLLVHGSHDRAARRINDIAIEIEASQAFGTGHHGTTAGCLAAMADLARAHRFRNVLDLGTGSGVLAIAAARLWHATVLATDIDPRAAVIANENARLNGVGARVTSIAAIGFRHRAFKARGPFDLIVANILAAPLAVLAPELARHLAPGGSVILSGLLPGQRRMITAAYRNQGLSFVRASVRDGWLTLVLRK